ncbi:MAG: hypothetical protein HC849_17740 [Oscillatoriales cyanobacterium RU_3_3]|nr:hypothetical protein [Microcoleus sp. SU_5_6]NJL69767.1 hypothetical protein [Microcoleus sp. SM1_3_4]NJM61622.1 hypothetical protein [Oscillatoriales cyanobacterium RU_3_3]NJR24853.1 hypothetical protein [Richelia sp. CSU_2_1]
MVKHSGINPEISITHCRPNALPLQLSIVNCQLSTVNYQRSTVNYQLSTIYQGLPIIVNPAQ